ncbi:MAG: glycosyl hydrolase [Cyclobacteriaceae bacterium]
MKNFIFLLLTIAVTVPVTAQRKKKSSTYPAPTSATERWNGYEQRQLLEENSLITQIPFKNIGPTIMSGRVVDIAVDPDDYTHFYVAYASGGLWETKNEGASFTPLFDNEIVMTIGDIDVDWKNNIIYVGSGENNSSRSSYAGYGVFKSEDNGQSWQHLGLAETQHVGRIIIHPTDPNIIWVGALGHLYSENKERGIYKSDDGGKTWNKTLFVNNRTGIIELAFNPENPNELIAGAWEKDRKAWNFVEAGNGSGLYKSSDAGSTWQLISNSDSGFPDTDGMGRVGISYGANDQVFVVLDNQDRRVADDKKEYTVDKEKLRNITVEAFLQLANDDINEFLDRRRFPRKYNAVDIKSDVKAGKIKPSDLVAYVEDANSMLFDTPVKGAEVYQSNDGGISWAKTHEDYIESTVFSYGYYFGQIRHNPFNPDHLYILGVPVLKSEDGGKSWASINGDNVHVDHHALWINPDREGHLILGNDGGINISKDNGETWSKCNSIPVGQFYYVNVDMEEPYNVYGGLQDNGVWKGPSTYEFSNNWQQDGKYPYEELMGGDGMQVQIDSRDNATVYTGFQFGNYFRINTQTGQRKRITPIHELGESPYRWNWQAPILISSHNQDIIYFGSNRFHRSMNQGDDFETMSGDLTNGGKKGDVSYGTLTTIAESPIKFGLLYVGSDDGLIHVSKDAGANWARITSGLPESMWVSRVVASQHKEGRVYASLNGYRWDNFNPMIYVSDDYGNNWKRLGQNLPKEPVNVIKEDPENENLLYIGTDHGVYASLDAGNTFMTFGNLPNTPVHDLVIHPRDKDLVIGTHGRSIFIGNMSYMQQMTSTITNKDLHLFPINPIPYRSNWGSSYWTWGEPNVPSIDIVIYSKAQTSGTLSVHSEDLTVYSTSISLQKGLNYVSYNLTIDQDQLDSYKTSLEDELQNDFKAGDDENTYLRPGTYKVMFSSNSSSVDAKLTIKAPKERPKRKGSK